MSASETKPVQMRLKQSTIDQITKIQSVLNSPNRTTAAKTAFDIADMVLAELTSGGQVELIDSHGVRRQILIPGVNTAS